MADDKLRRRNDWRTTRPVPHYLIAIRGPNVRRVRGLLAAHGIQNVVRDEHAVAARLNAESAEEAAARVQAAIGSEPYTLSRPEAE